MFFFSVLVLVLFSNEYPPLNMLNLYLTTAKANKYIVIGRRTILSTDLCMNAVIICV